MILETERLLLRPWEEADAEVCFEYAKDHRVGPAAGWPVHNNVEESRRVIREVLSVPETYAIVWKETGLPVGSVGLHHNDLAQRSDEAELGYWIGVPWWGRGIAPEAGREMLRHAFEDLGLQRVWCAYYDGNEKSKRVQEKLGFRYQWTTEEVPVPLLGETRKGHANLLTREEWATAQGPARPGQKGASGENEPPRRELRGKRVILREQRPEDAAFFAYWFNQPEIMFRCGFTEPTDEEKERAWILNEHRREDSAWFTITDPEGKLLGEAGLLRMFPAWHQTDLTIIIPDPEMQHRGYGTEAIRLILDLAFTKYEMHRVSIGVVGLNADALEFYRKIGFKQEGVLEDGYFWNNEYSDFIMMRILRPEWKG